MIINIDLLFRALSATSSHQMLQRTGQFSCSQGLATFLDGLLRYLTNAMPD